MSKKVLFISHDATRTGAPRSLLRLLKWLKNNSSVSFNILCRYPGEMINEFQDIGEVSLFYKKVETIKLREIIWQGLMGKFGLSYNPYCHNLKKLKRKLIHENIDLIYANTIANGDVLDFLSSFLNCPIICHVRELEYALHISGKANFSLIDKLVDQYIVVSQAVKTNLLNNHSINQSKVDLIYGYIDYKEIQDIDKSIKSNQIRKMLSIPNNAMVVAACGTPGWRKGTDLFIQLAYIIHNTNNDFPIYFLWLGGNFNSIEYYKFMSEIKKLNIENYIIFTGTVSNPLDYLSVVDVFVLPSREDPFPLVVLEAASLGIPTVTFDKSGGASEFVMDNAGIIVPYLDIQSMAEKTIFLLEDINIRKKLGTVAANKVKNQYDVSIAGSKILSLIERYLN